VWCNWEIYELGLGRPFYYVRIEWVKVKGLWRKNSQVKVFVLFGDVNYRWKSEF